MNNERHLLASVTPSYGTKYLTGDRLRTKKLLMVKEIVMVIVRIMGLGSMGLTNSRIRLGSGGTGWSQWKPNTPRDEPETDVSRTTRPYTRARIIRVRGRLYNLIYNTTRRESSTSRESHGEGCRYPYGSPGVMGACPSIHAGSFQQTCICMCTRAPLKRINRFYTSEKFMIGPQPRLYFLVICLLCLAREC